MSQKARPKSRSEGITSYFNLPNGITVANAVLGLLAIFHATIGEYLASALFMLAAVAADFADGRLARLLKRETDFGKQLDSLSDSISFGVAPAVFAYAQGLDSLAEVIVLCLFVSSGILRLARFGTIDAKGFIGVPITMNGIIFPMLYIATGMFRWWAIIPYALMGLLMISRIRIPKV